MTLNSNEDISNRIRDGKPQIRSFEAKAASPEKQVCFNILNSMQGKKPYFETLHAIRKTLKNE